MALFPKEKVRAPKMAHHDRSHYLRTSMAPGLGYPIYCREALPGPHSVCQKFGPNESMYGYLKRGETCPVLVERISDDLCVHFVSFNRYLLEMAFTVRFPSGKG